MKVAVASTDGKTISPHFGRSSCFLVFEIENGKITGQEVRDNRFTAHARGECHGDEQHEGHQGSHAAVVDALQDCSAVICYGMGVRAAEALASRGIRTFVLGERCTPEAAVSLFLEDKLNAAGQGFCQCHSEA